MRYLREIRTQTGKNKETCAFIKGFAHKSWGILWGRE